MERWQTEAAAERKWEDDKVRLPQLITQDFSEISHHFHFLEISHQFHKLFLTIVTVSPPEVMDNVSLKLVTVCLKLVIILLKSSHR